MNGPTPASTDPSTSPGPPAPPAPPAPPTARAARSDRTLLWVTGGAVLLAGLLVAGMMLLATSRGGAPPAGPFTLGSAESLAQNVREEGPVFYADPTGRSAGVWVDLEDGHLVALQVRDPTTRCTVKWKAPRDGERAGHYVDCHGTELTGAQLPRYDSEVPTSGTQEGLFLVDVRRVVPAPSSPPGR